MSRQDLHQRQVRPPRGRQDQRLRSRPAVRRRRVRGPAQLRRQGVSARRAHRCGSTNRPRRSGSRFRCRQDADVRRGRTRRSRVNEIDDGYIRARRHARRRHARPRPQPLQQPAGHHHRRRDRALSAGAVREGPGDRHRQRAAEPPGGAQPADQVAQLPQQHPRQDRRPAGRLHRSPDAQPQGRSGRVHGRQHLPRARRRAATRRRSTPASWKASRATP